MNKVLSVTFLGLIITGVIVFAQEQPAPSLPKEVKRGQQILADWLDSFVHKTQEQIEKQLGTATDKTTWAFEEKKELLLRYKTSENGTLSLYFRSHRVIKASYQLFSE